MTGDASFTVECINALDTTLLGLSEQERLGVISPQEAANLNARFLNLKAQLLRSIGRHEEAEIAEFQAVHPFTIPDRWVA